MGFSKTGDVVFSIIYQTSEILSTFFDKVPAKNAFPTGKAFRFL